MKLKRTIGKITTLTRTKFEGKDRKDRDHEETGTNQGTGIVINRLPDTKQVVVLTAGHCAFAGPALEHKTELPLTDEIEIESLMEEQKTRSFKAIPILERDLAILLLHESEDWMCPTTRVILVENPPEYNVLLGVYGVPSFLEEGYSKGARLREIKDCILDEMNPDNHEFYVETKRKSESDPRYVQGMSGGGVFVTHYKGKKSSEFLPVDHLVSDNLFLVGTVIEVKDGPENLKCESVDSLKGLPEVKGMEYWKEKEFVEYMEDRILIREIAARLGEACHEADGQPRIAYNLLQRLRKKLEPQFETYGNKLRGFVDQIEIAEGHSIKFVKKPLNSDEIQAIDRNLLVNLKQVSESFLLSPSFESFSSRIYKLTRNE